MKIVFSLIVLISNGYGGAPVKVGEYEKYRQCVQQGNIAVADASYQAPMKFFCIPVNATGNR